MWNLAREGGWESYRTLTDKYSEELEKVIEEEDDNIEDKMTNSTESMKE